MPQVTVEKIVEADSNITVWVDLQSDGSGELTLYPFLTPAMLNPSRTPGPTFNLEQAWYGLVWFDVKLYTNTLTPKPLWTFARDCDSHIDFRSFGGIYDRQSLDAPPTVDDGVLLMSTNGFQGGTGNMILRFKKNNAPGSGFRQ